MMRTDSYFIASAKAQIGKGPQKGLSLQLGKEGCTFRFISVFHFYFFIKFDLEKDWSQSMSIVIIFY
jgi:hypothetical protein